MSLSPIQVVPMPGSVGAEVLAGALQSIDAEGFARVHRAWLDHLFLLVREQSLSSGAFVDFARRFGKIKAAVSHTHAAGDPALDGELHLVSNVDVPGLPTGIQGHAAIGWHSDMAGFMQPPSASLLHALEVPPGSGDTSFCNMYAAYDTLPVGLRRRLVGYTVKHEVSPGSAGPGTGAVHPLVCTHPETGSNALFLGSGFNTHISELPHDESAGLLEFLWAHATQPEFIWRHRWQAGDVVVWDNRCLLHMRDGFDPLTRRVLLRTQVHGSHRPQVAPDALERPAHPRGRAQRVDALPADGACGQDSLA